MAQRNSTLLVRRRAITFATPEGGPVARSVPVPASATRVASWTRGAGTGNDLRMSDHRVFVAALATGLLAIASTASAQSRAAAPDELAWDVIDEDCGALPEGRSDERAPSAVPPEPEAPTVLASTSVSRDPTAPAPRRTGRTASHRAETVTATPDAVPVDPSHDGTLPRGRAVGRLTPEACEAVLRSEGVPFEREVTDATQPAVEQPIRLGGPLRGLVIRSHGGDESSIHSVIDCRLAVALLGWADEVRAAGFVAIEHVSIFRPGARVARTHRPSGHSHALALDALRFVRSDGTFFSVLDDWSARDRGTDPCLTYDEPEASAAVRRLVCSAATSETFQVVITPHHDDAHANHVHLEIVPGVDWTVAR
jgi:hypothetical protein